MSNGSNVTTDETWEQVDCKPYGLDYKVMNHAVIREKGDAWLDEAGAPYKAITSITGTNTLFNKDDPEIAVSGHFNIRVHSEPAGPESPYWIWKFTGVQWNVQVPGYGAVLHVSGQTVYLVDGWNPIGVLKNTGLWKWNYQALCAGLVE